MSDPLQAMAQRLDLAEAEIEALQALVGQLLRECRELDVAGREKLRATAQLTRAGSPSPFEGRVAYDLVTALDGGWSI